MRENKTGQIKKGKNKNMAAIIVMLLLVVIVGYGITGKIGNPLIDEDSQITGVKDGEIDTEKETNTELHKVARDMERMLKGGKPSEKYKSEALKQDIVNYYKQLQEKELEVVDIDSIIRTLEADTTGTGDSYVYEFERVEEEDTPEIFKASGVNVIKVVDLSFGVEDDVARVVYEGKVIYIHKSLAKETYTQLQEKAQTMLIEKEGDTLIITNELGNLYIKVELNGKGKEITNMEIIREV